ncbi:MAG: TRAP transporter large permease subunit, partial [Proteobacteria bacterium]
HHFRFIAPRVLDDHFAGSPILVTIPLFTFVGYVLARAKTAERLVRFSVAILGWIPGGLAIVCVLASAVFTLLTGGSGVTIIAIGGLLLPALRREGYSDKFSLGIITSGGSLGLLLPFSLPLLVYSLVAGVDTSAASAAVVAPGVLVLLFFTGYAMYVGVKEKVARKPFDLKEVLASANDLKWEMFIPVIMGVGIVKLQLGIDECAGIVAFYTVIIEVFVYKDISFRKDLLKITKSAMSMAGAVILILTMANALVNYVIQERIPDTILEKMLGLGLDQTWQFLVIMNVFLLALGMVMEGFSAIFVAVPLIIPFAARFHLGPFHVGMIFLLNLELAFCMPPLGLNLFISSFRFNRPATSLYRPILPFLGLLGVALGLISYVPWISNVMIRPQIAAERAKAEKNGDPPREAWLLECIQEDRLNPLPCTKEDQARYPGGASSSAGFSTSGSLPPGYLAWSS